MRRMPVVVTHQKISPVGNVLRTYPRDQDFRADGLRLRAQHDRRAMRIRRTDEVKFVALHALKSYPDVAVELVDDVPDVERSVGVGKRGRDENFTGHQEL